MLRFSSWKTAAILGAILTGLFFALPNSFSDKQLKNIPEWLPHDTLNLGLDLQGGSYMVLEVDFQPVLKETLQDLMAEARNALRTARVGYKRISVTSGDVVISLRKPADMEKATRALESLVEPVQTVIFSLTPIDNFEITAQGESTLRITMSEDAIRQRKNSIITQSIEIIRRRVDALGTTEPNIQRQGQDRILVEIPGVDDPTRLKNILGQTARLTFHMVDISMQAQQALQSRPPPGSEVLFEEDPSGVVIPWLVKKKVIVSGDSLKDAQAGFSEYQGPAVFLNFDSTGAKKFGAVTVANRGKPFAIVLDKKVLIAPTIQAHILDGRAQITGNFTTQQTSDLAILLRAGALPAPLTILEERSIGATLGEDSVKAGLRAAVIGFAFIIVFVVLSYGLFGIFANIALIANIGLILGVLSLLQATLTLPGIAGIVLTIGMAIDANVLIFERIREEMRANKTPLQAIETGYKRALGTILDANITTFVASVILFQLGSGPVRGFAVTLAIGIVTSVFTSFTFTRLLVSWWFGRKKQVATLPL